MNDTRYNGAVCGGIAPQLFGHQTPGFASHTFQESSEEAFGGPLIATGFDQDVNHNPILIDSPPEIVPLTLYDQEDFVYVLRSRKDALVIAKASGRILTQISDTIVGWSQ